jgi:hypothetical protein
MWAATGTTSTRSRAASRSRRSRTCRCFWQTLGRGGPAFPKPYVYAVGWAAPGITRLELTYQDGTHTRIPLDGRFYLFLVPASNWASGARPKTLTGLTAAGRRAGAIDLQPDQVGCYYPSDGCSFGTG